MSSKQQVRDAVARDLHAGAPDSRSRRREQVLSTWRTWCSANHQPELPTHDAEQQLLRFLHSNYLTRAWSWRSTAAAATLVAQFLESNGLPDPRTTRTHDYLHALQRKHGTRSTPPVDALNVEEIRAAVQQLTCHRAPGSETKRRQAILATADILEKAGLVSISPMTEGGCALLQSLHVSAFDIREDHIRITYDDKTALVRRESHPLHYEVISAAVAGGARQPLAKANGLVNVDMQHLRQSVGRTFLELRTRSGNRVPVDTAKRVWGEASVELRETLISNVDAWWVERVRNLAYFLVGLNGLHRHSELARLTVAHVQPIDTGFTYTLSDHKSANQAKARGAEGRPLIVTVEHLAADDACPATCPACALRALMHLHGRLQTPQQYPLFGSTRFPGYPASLPACTVLLKTVVNQALSGREQGGAGVKRIGTRTLRTTGATLLRQAGASYAEIQQAGSWANIDMAAMYVRRNDAWSNHDLVLTVDSQAFNPTETSTSGSRCV